MQLGTPQREKKNKRKTMKEEGGKERKRGKEKKGNEMNEKVNKGIFHLQL